MLIYAAARYFMCYHLHCASLPGVFECMCGGGKAKEFGKAATVAKLEDGGGSPEKKVLSS